MEEVMHQLGRNVPMLLHQALQNRGMVSCTPLRIAPVPRSTSVPRMQCTMPQVGASLDYWNGHEKPS